MGICRRGYGQSHRIIQDAIDRKAAKLAGYRKTFSEVWLFVVCSGGPGGTLDRYHFEWREYTSPFDRTIGLELFARVAALLKIRPANCSGV